MKITKQQLKRIIKEEIKSLKEAQEICSHGYCSPETLAKNHVVGLYREPGDHEGWLLKDFVNMWKPWCVGKEATEGYNEGNMVYLPWLVEMDSVKRPKYACDYAVALRDGLQDILEKGRVHPRNKKTMENFLTKIGGLVYPTTDIPIAEGQSMKITKQQLKRLIKEEVDDLYGEDFTPEQQEVIKMMDSLTEAIKLMGQSNPNMTDNYISLFRALMGVGVNVKNVSMMA